MSETSSRIEHAGEIERLLEAMSRPGGVSLAFEEQTAPPVNVLLANVIAGERLILDVTAAAEIASVLSVERPFRLTGQAHGAMVMTEPLVAEPCNDIPGRLRFACPYPDRLEVWHRRSAFRAELGPGMTVTVALEVDGVEKILQGKLLNLSLGGSLVQIPLQDAAKLRAGYALSRLEATFPSGQRFATRGEIRHVRTDAHWQRALLGCEFRMLTPKFERLIWFLVKEIERESARKSEQDDDLDPSSLFQPATTSIQVPPARRPRAEYATPMARRLAKIADYLNGQMVRLEQGEPIDSLLLSRHSDKLLNLLEEDREALLFASVCLHRDPLPVQHGLGVAIRLADLAAARNLPRNLLKAIAATAMIHDLGKALLPDDLLDSTLFDEAQRQQLASHVPLIHERLQGCRWLDPQAVRRIVVEINERLDGSGYPYRLGGSELSALSRMAMVVDVIDAMSRSRPDRGGWAMEETYRHMLTRDDLFDSTWVQRYIRHFGLHPIGCLARFTSGAHGWIQRLDAKGAPRQIAVVSPKVQLLMDKEIASLGGIESLVRAPAPELLPQQ
ncbi:HD domain-containing protein [Modicisalibacter ilicicola DSM 19980]|uniref:HD domain-containing protein n=1 Tax=Modicisalibacter ilicicola DSM 19980 TaxID=1121942 RepID=A0A1M4SDM6_9GAMM|nr:HD domain-containing phosphohydrolase [Halomonas ilicicola]SHE30310.1 HD domain-containing protein [Halomonas ilicicola DSM 19980]